MAKGPTLTNIGIMMILALFVTMMSFSMYTNIIIDNGGQIDNNYSFIYSALGDSYDDVVAQTDVISDKDEISILNKVSDFAFGTINVFVLGLKSIGAFFGYIPLLQTIFQIANDVFPQFNALIGLLITVISLYVAMRYIQSARGTSEQI